MSGEYSIDGYQKVVLSSTRNIFFKRGGEHFPVAGINERLPLMLGFKLTEFNFCVFDSRENITPGRKDYVLSEIKRTPCSENVMMPFCYS